MRCRGAVEEIDGRPEQVLEVGFEACVREGRDQGVEDVGDGAGDGLGFGQRPRVGLVVEGAIAVELEFGEDGGGDGVLGWRRVCVDMVMSFRLLAFCDRDPRGLFGVSS